MMYKFDLVREPNGEEIYFRLEDAATAALFGSSLPKAKRSQHYDAIDKWIGERLGCEVVDGPASIYPCLYFEDKEKYTVFMLEWT